MICFGAIRLPLAFQNQARANADKIRQMRLNVENAQESLLRNQAARAGIVR